MPPFPIILLLLDINVTRTKGCVPQEWATNVTRAHRWVDKTWPFDFLHNKKFQICVWLPISKQTLTKYFQRKPEWEPFCFLWIGCQVVKKFTVKSYTDGGVGWCSLYTTSSESIRRVKRFSLISGFKTHLSASFD